MKILLLPPEDPTGVRTAPDLGLGYLASYIRQYNHDVMLWPGDAKRDFSSLPDIIRQQHFDLIGIKVMCGAIQHLKRLISSLKAVTPKSMIVLGGPLVSAAPYNIFNWFPEAHYAFRSEAEIGFARFINNLEKGALQNGTLDNIPNLIWRRGTEVVVNKNEFVLDLDTLPFPAWDLMDPRSFHSTMISIYSLKYPAATMIATRGCPNMCAFCSYSLVNGRQVRSRSHKNILEEIKFLQRNYDVKEIQFLDSNIAHPGGPLRKLCKGIIEEKIKIAWCAPVGIRADSVDEELAHLMKSSGCFQVNVGIESASDHILKMIRKGITTKMVEEKVGILRDAGIDVGGFFMLGFPGEKISEIKKTVDFSMRIPLTSAAFTIFMPLPGTELYGQIYKNKDMEFEELASITDYTDYKNNLSEMPYSELKITRKIAFLRFFLRPKILIRLIKYFSTRQRIVFILARILNILSSRKRVLRQQRA